MRRSLPLLALLLTLTPALRADDQANAITREEVTAVKRKLQAIESALGTPPAGYERASENFNLPSELSPADASKGTFYPVNGSLQLKYDGGSQRLNQEANQQGQDVQKKLMAAINAGNYEEVAKIQQQMSQQATASQTAAIDASNKGTIDVNVSLNQSGGQGIDPDNILFEKPGVMAIKSPNPSNPGQGHVTVYFDPVALKNTKAATIAMRSDPTTRRAAVLNATVDLTGPSAPTEAWAKKIATDPVLAQLDR